MKQLIGIGVLLLSLMIVLPALGSFLLDESSYWCTEIVDDTGNTGRYTSIDLDSNAYPHISYCREDNGGYVKYAYWDGLNWVIETLDEGFDESYGNVLTTSIAIDSNDEVHIVYAKPPTMIMYAYYDGINLEKTTVYTGQGILGSVSIAVDNSDNPHISYCDGLGSFKLRYAHKEDSEWINEIVDTTTSSGFHNSISLDANDGVHIAYSNLDQKTIRYAYKDGSAADWQVDIVDDTIFGSPNYPAIDVDSEDVAHIGYFDAGKGYNHLKYAYKNDSNSAWNIETIISDKPVGYSYSLALSNQDNPYLMYQNIESKDLEIIYKNETSWITEPIDAEGKVGCCSDIVFSPQGIVFISYRDEENGDLKCAFLNAPPNIPEINGPLQGNIEEEIRYTIVTSDPNNHQIKYTIDWGDDTKEIQIGPYLSGEEQILSHRWQKKGDYTIKVMAEDVYGAESDWGTLEVSMQKRKTIITHPIISEFFEAFPQLLQLLERIIEI